MAKFEKFNPVSHLRGLRLAAEALQRELSGQSEEQLLSFNPETIEREERERLAAANRPRRNRKRVN